MRNCKVLYKLIITTWEGVEKDRVCLFCPSHPLPTTPSWSMIISTWNRNLFRIAVLLRILLVVTEINPFNFETMSLLAHVTRKPYRDQQASSS